MAGRTVRKHVARLVKMGVIEKRKGQCGDHFKLNYSWDSDRPNTGQSQTPVDNFQTGPTGVSQTGPTRASEPEGTGISFSNAAISASSPSPSVGTTATTRECEPSTASGTDEPAGQQAKARQIPTLTRLELDKPAKKRKLFSEIIAELEARKRKRVAA